MSPRLFQVCFGHRSQIVGFNCHWGLNHRLVALHRKCFLGYVLASDQRNVLPRALPHHCAVLRCQTSLLLNTDCLGIAIGAVGSPPFVICLARRSPCVGQIRPTPRALRPQLIEQRPQQQPRKIIVSVLQEDAALGRAPT